MPLSPGVLRKTLYTTAAFLAEVLSMCATLAHRASKAHPGLFTRLGGFRRWRQNFIGMPFNPIHEMRDRPSLPSIDVFRQSVSNYPCSLWPFSVLIVRLVSNMIWNNLRACPAVQCLCAVGAAVPPSLPSLQCSCLSGCPVSATASVSAQSCLFEG